MLYSGWLSSLGLVRHSNISIASLFNSASKSSSSFDIDDDDKNNDDDDDDDCIIDEDDIDDLRKIECFFIVYGNHPYANDDSPNITNIKPVIVIIKDKYFAPYEEIYTTNQVVFGQQFGC